MRASSMRRAHRVTHARPRLVVGCVQVVANFGKSLGAQEDRRTLAQGESARRSAASPAYGDRAGNFSTGSEAASSNAEPKEIDPAEVPVQVDEDEAIADLDLDDITIDEANLPHLDTEDPETIALQQEHDDLLDRRWLERAPEEDDDDERSALDELGVTIELNAAGAEDDAQVVDLDIGDLLDALPLEGTDVQLSLEHERSDNALGVAALRDMLLPESEADADTDDGEVGDDHRFPVFDDGAPAWRPVTGDDEGPEGEPS